jgi:hypothetical protein
MKRASSLRRSGSRRSSKAGSVRSLALQPGEDADEMSSAFYSPVPTSGNPTEILAARFQAWRKFLKDLIAYYKEVSQHYEYNTKNVLKISNLVNNITTPPMFLSSGGIHDGLEIMRNYHRTSAAESKRAADIENDVILALTGLRSDLSQKIKEIKNLSGDFKNSVDKEMENTRKAVHNLQEALGQSDIDSAQIVGRQDPYLLRLAVDRQIERQIEEENYLHQAYLNLEASGRELESIVIGEIQKSYNALATILKREADAEYAAIDELRTGPISMNKDLEFNAFIAKDDHFVDPRIPVREADHIQYPGRHDELASEIRAGLLERKTKYLKTYTAAWFVLTPTHLHEFKSPDKSGAPVMSLYLPEQKLGSHSDEGKSSNKFMLKGRQTGSMHRGHSWVFRAESFETMIQWYEDLKALTEKSPQERHAFVRQHARSISGTSQKPASVSSDGVMDEDDEEPFSATASSIVAAGPKQDVLPKRPNPGGRFPSEISKSTIEQHGLLASVSPSSGSSGLADFKDRDLKTIDAAPAPPISHVGQNYAADDGSTGPSPTHAARINQYAKEDGVNPYTYEPISQTTTSKPENSLLTPTTAGAAAVLVSSDVYHHTTAKDALADEPGQTPNETIVANTAHPATKNAGPPQSASFDSATTDTLDNMHQNHAAKSHVAGDAPTANVEPQAQTIERPTLPTGQSHISEISVGQLHVPGEYPKNMADLK